MQKVIVDSENGGDRICVIITSCYRIKDSYKVNYPNVWCLFINVKEEVPRLNMTTIVSNVRFLVSSRQ